MNVSALKTPGVFINEIDAFPPSVAQVATAIPAFVGYTETGPSAPTRITSFLEFEQTFGGAPIPASIAVELDANMLPTVNTTVTESRFKLYNSLALFYANGGGVCYIVSIGRYSAAIDSVREFTDGLELLRKFDEPTLLLFPDAVNLETVDLGLVQQAALKQCADLTDRFAILDVRQRGSIVADCADFRDAVQNQNLKFGAAYYPYLRSSLPYRFRFTDINGTAAGKVNFKAIFASNIPLRDAIAEFEKKDSDFRAFNALWSPFPVPNDLINPKILQLPVNDKTSLDKALEKSWGLLKSVGHPLAASTQSASFANFMKDQVDSFLKQYATELINFRAAYNDMKVADGSANVIALAAFDNNVDFTGTWGNISTTAAPAPAANPYTEKVGTKITPAAPALAYYVPDFTRVQMVIQKLHATIFNAMKGSVKNFGDFMGFEENNLISQIPLYKGIVSKLSESMNTLPPSGAMAGLYAMTDSTRGVWKAPANVSISQIIGLTRDINDADQMDMNIHESGKSVNALRQFSGKGFLVWGGRTLAGNSNDWRYVSVRRLAIMIEESVKKACMQFVFEPNVAQTWVNVKGMIDNYLTTVWNDGGLAGSKPSDAFFVAVGIKETMSAQDILEGRMIVKVGYAPSRPAEFIWLEFKQMQQVS